MVGKKRWLLGGVAMAALAVVGALAVRGWMGPAVSALVVKAVPLTRTVVATGRVSSAQESALGSTVTARVVETPVAEGAQVRAGTILVRLESEASRADRAATAASLAEAEATLAEAQRQHARQLALFQRGFISRAALDSEEKTLRLAQTRREAAAAQLKAVEARLGELAIRAPADGQLLARDVEVGDLATAGKAILTFAAAGRTEIRLDVDERHLGSLRVGQAARVLADAYPDQPFDAAVSEVAPRIDRERGTLEVRLLPQRPPAFLRQDMTVSAEVVVAQRASAIVVPASAVADPATAPWVWRVEGGRVQKRPVRLGSLADGQAEILAGLAEGDTVLTTTGTLEAGQRVRPQLPGAH